MTREPRGKKGLALVWTQTFLRTAGKFIRRHPELAGLLEDVLKQLERDPLAPRLRLHPLKERHSGKHAVSLTYEHRVVIILRLKKREVVLLDIGTHDEVYRDIPG